MRVAYLVAVAFCHVWGVMRVASFITPTIAPT